MNEWVKVLLPIVAGLAITVIGYFLRQSFTRIDRMHNDLAQLRQDTVRREEYDKASTSCGMTSRISATTTSSGMIFTVRSASLTVSSTQYWIR